MTDPRLTKLRNLLRAAADPERAAYNKAYLKSELQFFGMKTDVLRSAIGDVFPSKSIPPRTELEPLMRKLWASDYFEERAAALNLMRRVRGELAPADLGWIKTLSGDCRGWALLDTLACDILSPLALQYGTKVYKPVRAWTADDWMWTRRASVLAHIVPARKNQLGHDYAWPTFEQLLPEKEFFIRKAVGWMLRECCKHYSQEVHDFLIRVGDRASGLTRREGARKLPDKLRIPILGK